LKEVGSGFVIRFSPSPSWLSYSPLSYPPHPQCLQGLGWLRLSSFSGWSHQRPSALRSGSIQTCYMIRFFRCPVVAGLMPPHFLAFSVFEGVLLPYRGMHHVIHSEVAFFFEYPTHFCPLAAPSAFSFFFPFLFFFIIHVRFDAVHP